ncbi:diguanylate cyclase (GGDEF) domain-containing protein [Halopseudomonas sabulinigri]|uniref:cyclic-guanylate-specific phosphodiesterase n=1 Tax=Halopseudomonas sabulinigri TaxID=472181 RepID=A0A1H1MCA5_9GAMM|nr:EAL domain-containing protein [Halopseudomonas sabulinigri]SDR84280.1 diguanylate cyclase (GGDEF) domain-containing protein [Halopseudomonas sabulinigri]
MPNMQEETDLESLLQSNVRTQQADRLMLIANALAVILLLIALRTLSSGDLFNSGLVAAAFTVVMFARRLNRRGRVDASVRLVLVALTLVVSLSMWHSQGLYSGAILAFPALLVVAGTVASRGLFLTLLGLMLCVVAFISYAAVSGLKAYYPAPMGVGRVVVVSCILVVSALAISLLMRDLRSARMLLQQEMRRLHSSEAKLTHLAHHDPLTDLPNREAIATLVQGSIERARGQGRQLALLFVDIDNFKTINDSLGYAAGDELLQAIAGRLKQAIRGADTVSRQGGDEFIMTLPDLDSQDTAITVARRMQEIVSQPIQLRDMQLITSLSIGIALFPRDGDDFSALLRKAELAMQRAKSTGRNSYCLFDEQMNVNTHERLGIEQDLRQALVRSEFVLHFQPIVDLTANKLVGAEALLRWHHPERGLLGPDLFIGVAEQSGLITEIGEWVLNEACHEAARWQRQGARGLAVSVNLSTVQLHRGDLEAIIAQALVASALPPALLELELTESMLLEKSDSFIQRLRSLKELGVKLSIDDFGTGYSNLSYLQRFQVDKLKIDKSFVTNLSSNEQNRAIVTAIIQMAHSLKLKTTAEGIEHQVVKTILTSLGCHFGQGYLFAKPMPADDFLGLAQQARVERER